ncbi:MAG: hypothetical protein ACRCZP_12815, partial [Phycicoccus sp.]
FRKVGLDGQTSMGLLSQGLQAGARDADIVADAIKELSIRAVDGSKEAAASFEALGLNAEEMRTAFARGGPEAAAAFDLVVDRLRTTQGSADAATIAFGLFGTQSEDLGAALYALDPSAAAAGLGVVAGAAERLDATIGATAEAKVTAMQRGFEQWSASLIATDGPLGDVAAKVAAFGPQAVAAAAAVAPLLVALRMQGVADAVRGASRSVDEVGEAADRSERRSGRLGTTLKGLGAAAALGAIAVGLDQINVSAAGGEENLTGMAENLHDIVGAGEQILTLDIGNIFSDIGAEWDQLVDQFSTGQSVIGQVFAWFEREAQGHVLDPITVDINADPQGALTALDTLMADVNAWSGEVNINGNTNPAGFALRQILAEIAAGAETVLIDGEPMPAQEALDHVIGLINMGAGEVTVNGNTMPAGEALAQFLGATAASEGRVLIGADVAIAQQQLVDVQAQINAAMGTVSINGNTMPADQSLGAVLAAIDAGAATVTINGQSVPATQALGTLLGQIDAGAGTVTINGQSVPAGQALAALIQSISASQGTSTINGNATPAYNALSAFISAGGRQVTTPTVNADTSRAQNALNALYVRWNGRVISLQASTAGRLAAGAIVPSRATWYASGGVDQPMKRMPVGVPAVAQPGMLRVFGDRSDVPESYIPWKRGNARANALLGVTADALGFAIVPRGAARFASGGVALSDPSARAAAQEILNRISSGGAMFEDLTWRGSSSNVGRWNDPLINAYRQSGSRSIRDFLTGIARGSATHAAPAAQPQVARAVAAAPMVQAQARTGAGIQAVADAATRAEIAALRREIAANNYGPAQLAALRGVADAVRAARPAGSAQGDADAAGRRADGGAW